LWYCDIDFSIGIALHGIGGGEAWHGVTLHAVVFCMFTTQVGTLLIVPWHFLCAAALHIMLQHVFLCCSVFLLAAATSLLPKQNITKLCAWQQWGNVSHHHELHWQCYQLWGWFYNIATRSLTKQKTINLCGVWCQLQCWWCDTLLLCHWHFFFTVLYFSQCQCYNATLWKPFLNVFS